MKKVKRARVGRKFDPLYPRTVKEKRAQVDVVRCGLEAAAAQLRQCGLNASARAVMEIADQCEALKKHVTRSTGSN